MLPFLRPLPPSKKPEQKMHTNFFGFDRREIEADNKLSYSTNRRANR